MDKKAKESRPSESDTEEEFADLRYQLYLGPQASDSESFLERVVRVTKSIYDDVEEVIEKLETLREYLLVRGTDMQQIAFTHQMNEKNSPAYDDAIENLKYARKCIRCIYNNLPVQKMT